MNFNYLKKLDSLTGPNALVTHREIINELWRWVYIEKDFSRDEILCKVEGLLLGLKIAGLLTNQEHNELRNYYTTWFSL